MTLEQIPDLDHLREIVNDLKKQFEASNGYCDAILWDLKTVNHINTKEKSNYLNTQSEIEYLIQDFRIDTYSSFLTSIRKLQEFKNNLDSYDSDL